MMTRFVREYRQTLILVTHDQEMAAYADRIITLKDGEIVRQEWKEKEKEYENE